MGDLLKGRNIIIMGIRNRWSIAWGIAEAAHKQGATLIFTYQGEHERTDVEKLSAELGGITCYRVDVASDDDLNSFFSIIKEKLGVIHGLVHAIAYAKREDLQDSFMNTSRDGFALALDISAYSLVAVSRRASELMTEGGSIVTLTYMGSEKVFPGYNVMGVAKSALEACVRYLANDLGQYGIRINAISAGAVKTLSAKGVKNFGSMLKHSREKAPMKKNVELEELGGTAVFLLSSLAGGTTGEVIHVDGGMNIMGI